MMSCDVVNSLMTISSKSYMLFTASAFVTFILICYVICVAEDHCVAWLPFISDTWVYPPGNYISRWCVGMFCGCLAVCQFFIYWINEGLAAGAAPSRAGRSRSSKFCSNELLLVMALIAVFCLSWVGAICDSTVPSCRGNNTIHSTFAVTFFALYDIYMLVLHCNAPAGRHPFRTLKMVVSIATKARWLPHLLQLDSIEVAGIDWNLVEAIFEWTNVTVIMLWTAHYVISHPISATLKWAIVQGPQDELQSAGVLSYLSCRVLANIVAMLYVGCLVLSYIAGVHQGTLPTDHVPFISDMWVYPPGNWLSRWAVVQGVHAGLWCQTFLFLAQGGSNATAINKLGWFVSVCALLGLSVVGCVNEDENIVVHSIAASIYFGGYDFYMLTQVLFGVSTATGASPPPSSARKCWRVVMVVAMLVAFVCQAIRYCGKLNICQQISTLGLRGSAPEIAEWVDAIAIITFMYADVYSKDATKEYFVSVVQVDAQSRTRVPGEGQGRSRASSRAEAGELEVKLLTGEL